MNKRLLRALLLSISTLPVLSALARAGDATWVEVTSPHFSVVTDAGERRGREVATRFEQMRAVFAQLMTQAKVNTPIPLQVVAFRNNKELKQVSPLWNGKPVELAGLFQSGSDRCFIMLDMAQENPWTTVFHEYAHQLMNGTLSKQMDPWFEEGFAEYFSSIEVDSHQARVGKVPQMTYEIIRHEGMMKVPDLFRVQHNSATYNESGNKRTVFYAESSMVVHYLYDNGLIPKLALYFDLKRDKGLSVEEAIQQAFGMSAANFDKTIRSYSAGGQYRYHAMKTPADIETTGYKTRALNPTDAAAVIADIHFHSPDYRDKAALEFEDILKKDPSNASALRGTGYIYLQNRDFENAGEYFQRAAKADPKDSRVHYYNGLLMNLKASDSQSDLTFVTDELKTAVALDPDFADAYMQLAFAQSRAGDLQAAIASVKKAIALNPRNDGYYFNAANIYLQQRKTADALSIYRALTKSNDPIISARASAQMAQIEQMEAEMKEMESAERVRPEQPERQAFVEPVSAPTASDTSVAPAAAMKFLKGTIVSVDCSSAPAATVVVSSSGKKWKMQVHDSQHVLVLGTDRFSCNWGGQKAALNYRDAGESAGTVVSIEIQ